MLMYFEDRAHAGKTLAVELLEAYRYEDCAVVALSDGGAIVGEQIAQALHCVLTMLLIEDVEIPGEGLNIGGISQSGKFAYNSSFSSGEISEYESEYHGYIEEKKREAFNKINRLLGDGGIISEDMLRDRVVILVSDGLDIGSSLDVASDYLKPIRIKKLVMATPIATVEAVDKLHVMADELHILDVKTNYLGVNHYYENNDMLSHEETIKRINKVVLNWK